MHGLFLLQRIQGNSIYAQTNTMWASAVFDAPYFTISKSFSLLWLIFWIWMPSNPTQANMYSINASQQDYSILSVS